MSYKHRFQEGRNLVVIVFTGVVTYHEEVQVVLDVVGDPRMERDARFLVDRTRASMAATPEDVMPHIRLIGENLERFGSPRVANVVTADHDFGMIRMLEMRSEPNIDHDMMVFRSLDEACAWLEIEPGEIEWP